MARTVASEKRKALAAKAHGYKFKAAAVDHILSNHYIADNQLLTTVIVEQEQQINRMRRRINQHLNTISIGNSTRTLLEHDNQFMDAVVRDIFIAHPTIAFEYRNRISYGDIPTVDPDASDAEETVADFSDEDPEDTFERHMAAEGFF